MKILIFKAYYEPEKTASLYLTSNLIEDLAQMGFHIELYVPTPSRGVSKEIRKKYKKIKNEKKYNGKVSIIRFALFRENSNLTLRILRYILSNLIYLYNGIFSKGIDVIYVGSTPPTMGLVAVILKKIKKVPVIYSLQDVFPDSLVNTGITKEKSLLWKIGRYIEDYIYSHTDKIIVISEDFKENLLSKSVPKEKIEVIYNWVDEKEVIPIPRNDNLLFEKFNLCRDKFYIVYAGNLGYAQNIEVILKVAKKLIHFKEIEFIIFGNGEQESYYKNMASNLGLDNLSFFPLQSYSLVSHVYSLGDVSIVSCKKGLGKSAMPSKTWSIMSAGTAVIANFDPGTDLQRIITYNQTGVFTSAGDLNGLKEAILKLYYDRSLCVKMGENGRLYIETNLSRKNATRKYINIFNELGGK